MRLTTRVHDRDAAGLTYVYPVVSRRSQGVSVGINLNTNNACNWRCIYCQVPGLTRGKGPEVDLEQLERELVAMLDALVNGDYMERHVPPSARRINDVAFSGNGEPTSSPRFAEAVELAARTLHRFDLSGRTKLVLITNGSIAHQPAVQEGLRRLGAAGGEVWFKVDSATDEGMARINDVRSGVERQFQNLKTCAGLCPTWIQTLVFARDGEPPTEAEQEAYLSLVRRALGEGVELGGVHLYGLARPSLQPEAPHLSPLPAEWMESLADRIRTLGPDVRVAL